MGSSVKVKTKQKEKQKKVNHLNTPAKSTPLHTGSSVAARAPASSLRLTVALTNQLRSCNPNRGWKDEAGKKQPVVGF